MDGSGNDDDLRPSCDEQDQYEELENDTKQTSERDPVTIRYCAVCKKTQNDWEERLSKPIVIWVHFKQNPLDFK